MLPTTVNVSLLNGESGFSTKISSLSAPSGTIMVNGFKDINGDGIDDFGVGYNNGLYVVFGDSSGFRSPLDLSKLSEREGFFINSTVTSFNVAGDVNGDGLNDIIVGNDYMFYQSGIAYLLYGNKSFPPVVNIPYLNGAGGFTISDSFSDEHSGYSVSGSGDYNGDGFSDLIIGSPNAMNDGKGFVVYGGQNLPEIVDVSDLNGKNGFTIYGDQSELKALGKSVANAGDFNGDGLDDVLIAADNGAFLIHGSRSFSDVFDIHDINGTNGFKVASIPVTVVSGGKDTNGDNFDDIIVGGKDGLSGSAYLILGSSTFQNSSFNVKVINGDNGVHFCKSLSSNVKLGDVLALIDDVNGDGLGDIMMSYCLYGCKAAMVYGSKSFPATIDPFDSLNGENGITMYGRDGIGQAVGGAGDINNDGLGDMLIGTGNTSNPDNNITFVLYGEYFVPSEI